MKKSQGFATRNIHAGNDTQFPVGAVNQPIYASSTFVFPSPESGARRFALKEKGMIYSRVQNPTVEALEKKLAVMEGDGDYEAIAFASGMSAIATLFFHFLEKDDEIIAHKAIYGGTYHFLTKIITKFGIKTKIVDFTSLEKVKKAITSKTRILYFETPTNPLLEVIDIQAVSGIGKKNKILVVIDNTFTPPFIQSPLKEGVDITVYSLTKSINGHSDVIAGAIVGSRQAINQIRYKTSMFLGGTMSPFSAFLVARGMASLKERLQTHCHNGQQAALFLNQHPKVEKVFYPGLTSHKDHQIAKKQMYNGYGGILSFILKGGYNAGKKLMQEVKMIKLAVSLGGVESLIEHPASMTHSEYSKEEREKFGIYDGLVRLAVGLEDTEDIIADLSQAFKKL